MMSALVLPVAAVAGGFVGPAVMCQAGRVPPRRPTMPQTVISQGKSRLPISATATGAANTSPRNVGEKGFTKVSASLHDGLARLAVGVLLGLTNTRMLASGLPLGPSAWVRLVGSLLLVGAAPFLFNLLDTCTRWTATRATAGATRLAVVWRDTSLRLWARVWLGGARLVVWDFDNTILRGFARPDHEVAARWREDVADANLFRAFVLQAHEMGVGVGIASFQQAEVIGEYLDHLVPGAFRPQDIVTSGSLVDENINNKVRSWTDNIDNKVRMLDLLCSRASPAVTDRSAVLFFDDDWENIRDCLRAGFTRSTHTPGAFTRRALAVDVCGWLVAASSLVVGAGLLRQLLVARSR